MPKSSPEAKPTDQPPPTFVTRNVWDFFRNKIDFWVQNLKFPAKTFQLLKNQPFSIGINHLIQHTIKVATARMSSETAPVSEPVDDYSDDKHVPAAACVES